MLKSVLYIRELWIKAKCLHQVIVPTMLYGAEAWGMRSAERAKVNVLEMKCFISLVGVSQMDKGKVFYGQEPPWGESTTPECGFNYQLLAVIY